MRNTVLTENVVEQDPTQEILYKILEGRHIKSAYQPIVSLTNGNVFGFEALCRISEASLTMNIEQMFRLADKMNKAWELEVLCREAALKNAIHMGCEKKLFLNVNPNILHDEGFRNGFTKNRLDEYGIDFRNIIFEITERVAIIDNKAFLDSINHYKRQHYGIAIDDVGAGYSGLNTLSAVKPDIIKLDMNLVRNIDKDELKQLLCKSMVEFCNNANIKLIAEGIESEDELETLIKLNVDFGQGFFLGVPQNVFADIAPEKIEMINKYHTKKYNEKIRSSVYPIIGNISKPGYCFSHDERIDHIYDIMRLNPGITEFAIIEDNNAVGFMTKTAFNEMLGGRYGFNLHSRKSILQITNTNFLKVNYNMPVDQVSRLAMQRPLNMLYDPIVVECKGKYIGIVTVKDIVNTCTKIEMDIAIHSNPLTGLPGNLLIEKEILNRIFENNPYCITYYDIDNFKAYNDAYGFQNGDMMLALLANILKQCAENNEFIGHIGGDDFIVISDYHEGEYYCKSVIDKFSLQVTSLYRDEDIRNGYIVSKNRNGVTENFPIASLSIAGISNKITQFKSIDIFSKYIAQIKKNCKKHPGNYFEIH